MIKELLYKWFGLENEECKTCEVLQRELDLTRREKELLLDKLLQKNEPVKVIEIEEEAGKPLRSTRTKFMPSVVRQELMAAEDRKALELMQQHKKDRIEALENEVLKKKEGEEDASKVS